MADQDTTPMMKQYLGMRRQLPEDTLLFFRLGDFYEMFFEDAKKAADILDIALTKRNKIPMCGVPYHSSESYLARLIRAGMKVAICEQTEDPGAAKGIVKREIVRVVTPGAILEDQVLDADRNNYLGGLCRRNGQYGLALLDLSTGDFRVQEASDPAAIRSAMAREAPAEVVVPEEDRAADFMREVLDGRHGFALTPGEDWLFDPAAARDVLTRHFRVHSLEGFGCEHMDAGVCAAGAILYYVTRELHQPAHHVSRLRASRAGRTMLLDEATIANLDLIPTRPGGAPGASAHLLHVLDTTRTAMGSRMLRRWLLHPLLDRAALEARHQTVEALARDRRGLQELRGALAEVKDLERLLSRLGSGSGNARDLKAVAQSLRTLPALRDRAGGVGTPLAERLAAEIEPLPDLADLLDRAIVDEPPVTLREGGLIKRGYHADLDDLHSAGSEGKQWIADFQSREQRRTGIKSLKIRHNKVFGYYIEVTKANLDDVPDDYIRKQTLVNAERFITPELKEWENKILGAHERAVELEYELFTGIRRQVVEQTDLLQRTAAAIAALDVLAAFAERALVNRYVRPTLHEDDRLVIRDGRHPVIEQMLDAEPFVPNDTDLDGVNNQILVITGPNMAGKSTYIRQVALLTIMAQAGSFVSATAMDLGLVDRVFTRVGASDDLVRGRSTFMVEMQETANILHNATPRSLIVLDEIGRGTSTFDGISIAWAVAEFLHTEAEVKARTLFATHYHELTDLAMLFPGIRNYNVLVRERDDKIVFLRKIAPGAADKSYGIQVGRLAGLPAPVISRAKEVLSNLEEGEFGESGQPQIARHRPRKKAPDANQLSLFGDPADPA